ncbi:MAG: SAM-dependent methyltransferase, partial [Streptosporangiales bacterium]
AEVSEMTRRMNQRMARTHATLRDRAQITGFFAGLDLAEPGVVQPQQWRPGPGDQGPDAVTAWCGVAGKR